MSMIGKRALILGLAVLAGGALCASARQPDDANGGNVSSALQQLVQMANTSPNHRAKTHADPLPSTDGASSYAPNGVASNTTGSVETRLEAGAPTLQRRYPRYRVETGDALSIQFSFVTDFNQAVTVQPDGYINLREVGDLHVAGLTAPQITARVREAYAKILNDPVVSVSLTDFDKPYFLVGGQVAHPGKFDLRGDTTVAEAIQIAGGFTDKSKDSQVLLFRKVSANWVEARKLDMKKMLRAGNLAEDLHLEPGDMLFVPQNRISKIERFLPLPHPGIILNPSRL
jgi:polysaccharide export outer membrane protein